MIWDNKSNIGSFIFGELFLKWKELEEKLGFPKNISYIRAEFMVQDFEGGRLKFNKENKIFFVE